MKSFKFTTFYNLETKFKALGIIQGNFLEIGQFLSAQRAFEKKQLFLGHSVDVQKQFAYEARFQLNGPVLFYSFFFKQFNCKITIDAI